MPAVRSRELGAADHLAHALPIDGVRWDLRHHRAGERLHIARLGVGVSVDRGGVAR